MSITLHMVASLDGFVAKQDDDFAWMRASWGAYDKGVELTEELAAEVVQAIDCYLIGSRTYELAVDLGWPYGDKPTIVVTSRKLNPANENVEFYSGDLKTLANELGQKNVWLVGGPMLSDELFRLGLVDKVCLTIAPILLGDGVGLFNGAEQRLHLKEMTAFKNGMIDLWYDVARPDGDRD